MTDQEPPGDDVRKSGMYFPNSDSSEFKRLAQGPETSVEEEEANKEKARLESAKQGKQIATNAHKKAMEDPVYAKTVELQKLSNENVDAVGTKKEKDALTESRERAADESAIEENRKNFEEHLEKVKDESRKEAEARLAAAGETKPPAAGTYVPISAEITDEDKKKFEERQKTDEPPKEEEGGEKPEDLDKDSVIEDRSGQLSGMNNPDLTYRYMEKVGSAIAQAAAEMGGSMVSRGWDLASDIVRMTFTQPHAMSSTSRMIGTAMGSLELAGDFADRAAQKYGVNLQQDPGLIKDTIKYKLYQREAKQANGVVGNTFRAISDSLGKMGVQDISQMTPDQLSQHIADMRQEASRLMGIIAKDKENLQLGKRQNRLSSQDRGLVYAQAKHLQSYLDQLSKQGATMAADQRMMARQQRQASRRQRMQAQFTLANGSANPYQQILQWADPNANWEIDGNTGMPTQTGAYNIMLRTLRDRREQERRANNGVLDPAREQWYNDMDQNLTQRRDDVQRETRQAPIRQYGNVFVGMSDHAPGIGPHINRILRFGIWPSTVPVKSIRDYLANIVQKGAAQGASAAEINHARALLLSLDMHTRTRTMMSKMGRISARSAASAMRHHLKVKDKYAGIRLDAAEVQKDEALLSQAYKEFNAKLPKDFATAQNFDPNDPAFQKALHDYERELIKYENKWFPLRAGNRQRQPAQPGQAGSGQTPPGPGPQNQNQIPQQQNQNPQIIPQQNPQNQAPQVVPQNQAPPIVPQNQNQNPQSQNNGAGAGAPGGGRRAGGGGKGGTVNPAGDADAEEKPGARKKRINDEFRDTFKPGVLPDEDRKARLQEILGDSARKLNRWGRFTSKEDYEEAYNAFVAYHAATNPGVPLNGGTTELFKKIFSPNSNQDQYDEITTLNEEVAKKKYFEDNGIVLNADGKLIPEELAKARALLTAKFPDVPPYKIDQLLKGLRAKAAPKPKKKAEKIDDANPAGDAAVDERAQYIKDNREDLRKYLADFDPSYVDRFRNNDEKALKNLEDYADNYDMDKITVDNVGEIIRNRAPEPAVYIDLYNHVMAQAIANGMSKDEAENRILDSIAGAEYDRELASKKDREDLASGAVSQDDLDKRDSAARKERADNIKRRQMIRYWNRDVEGFRDTLRANPSLMENLGLEIQGDQLVPKATQPQTTDTPRPETVVTQTDTDASQTDAGGTQVPETPVTETEQDQKEGTDEFVEDEEIEEPVKRIEMTPDQVKHKHNLSIEFGMDEDKIDEHLDSFLKNAGFSSGSRPGSGNSYKKILSAVKASHIYDEIRDKAIRTGREEALAQTIQKYIQDYNNLAQVFPSLKESASDIDKKTRDKLKNRVINFKKTTHDINIDKEIGNEESGVDPGKDLKFLKQFEDELFHAYPPSSGNKTSPEYDKFEKYIKDWTRNHKYVQGKSSYAKLIRDYVMSPEGLNGQWPSFSGRTHSEYMPAYDGVPKPESSYKSKSEFVNDVFKYVNYMAEVSKALGTDEDLSHVDELKKMNDILKDIFSEIEAGLDDPRIDDKSKAKLAQLGTDLSSNWGHILSNMVPNGDERFDAVYHKAHTINATSKDTTGGQINRDVSESAQQTLAEQEENRRKAEEEEQARLEEAKNRNYKTYEDYATNVEFLKGWIDSAKDPSELETISKEIQDTIEEATRNNTLEHTSQGAVITMLNNLLSNDLGQKKHAMEISQPFLNFSDDRTKWAQFVMDEKDEAKHDQLYDAYMELLETDPVMSQDPEGYQSILDAAADADTESEMAGSVPIEQSTPESPEPETKNDETERALSDQLKATVEYMWSNFDSDYDEDKFEQMLTLIKNNSALQFKEKDDLLQRADIFRKMADMAQDAPHGAVNQADYAHVKEKLMNMGDGEDVLKMLQTLENIKLKSDKHNPAADRDQRSQDSILREEYDTEDSENPSKDVSEEWTLDSMDYERAKQIYNNTFGEDEPDNGEEPEWDHLVDLIYDSADSFSTEFSIREMISDLTELMELYDLDQREQDRLLRRVDSIPTMGENLRLYDARRSENGGPGKDVEPKSFREIMRERNPDWE